MIEIGLNARLRAQVPSVGNRVYPVHFPQNVVYPALTYEDASDPKGHDHGGPDGTVEARYTVTVAGGTGPGGYRAMKETSKEVEDALDGFSGAMSTEAVASIRCEGGADQYDDEMLVHFRAIDFIILYTQGD